jgi:hypothetical protein
MASSRRSQRSKKSSTPSVLWLIENRPACPFCKTNRGPGCCDVMTTLITNPKYPPVLEHTSNWELWLGYVEIEARSHGVGNLVNPESNKQPLELSRLQERNGDWEEFQYFVKSEEREYDGFAAVSEVMRFGEDKNGQRTTHAVEVGVVFVDNGIGVEGVYNKRYDLALLTE